MGEERSQQLEGNITLSSLEIDTIGPAVISRLACQVSWMRWVIFSMMLVSRAISISV